MPALPGRHHARRPDARDQRLRRRPRPAGGHPTAWLIPDLDAFARTSTSTATPARSRSAASPTPSARGNNRSVNEEDHGAYLQADFTFDWGIPVRGDIGVRYAQTEQTSQGYLPAAARRCVTAVQRLLRRAAVAEPRGRIHAGPAGALRRGQGDDASGARPVTPGGTHSLAATSVSRTGNPLLEPTRAKTFDLALSGTSTKARCCPARCSTRTSRPSCRRWSRPCRSTSRASRWTLLAGTTLNRHRDVRGHAPVNTEGGPLKGFELNYQQPFKFLPGALEQPRRAAQLHVRGFEDRLRHVGHGRTPPVKNDLVNLSQNAWNATLYYEDGGFSVRASASYRDELPDRGARAQRADDPGRRRHERDAERGPLGLVRDQRSPDDLARGLNLTDEANDQFIDTTRIASSCTRTRAGRCSWERATSSEVRCSSLSLFGGWRRVESRLSTRRFFLSSGWRYRLTCRATCPRLSCSATVSHVLVVCTSSHVAKNTPTS